MLSSGSVGFGGRRGSPAGFSVMYVSQWLDAYVGELETQRGVDHVDGVRVWQRAVPESGYEKVPVILVGNKVDLESEREVSVQEGQALAEEWGCPFIETSAKSKTMVDELFAEIVRQMDYAAQPDKDDPCCSSCNIQ
ncbi:ras-related protein Rap-2a isoform X3 [Danio rerio]|uniref:Ras-related protein Rap-2a isoform X3 n=1 Tax=Danio rerio TaxID=7955 RepID=A0AC58GFI2_DANRE